MVLKKENIKFLIFFVMISFILILVNCFKTTTIVSVNKNITDYGVQLTYYPDCLTGDTLGSGKHKSEFSTDSNGWYHYLQDGIDYLVVAAATKYCRDASNHCGVSVSKHGLATSVGYYDYGDTFTLNIGGTNYNTMVLDSCGACMWGRQDAIGEEKFDVYTACNPTNPAIYQPATKEGEVSSGNNFNLNPNILPGSDTIQQGFIYLRQLNNSLRVYPGYTDDDINREVNKIIGTIFRNATKYSIEPGSANSPYEIAGGSEDALTWKQGDPTWGKLPLGSAGETIHGVGCLATSVAIQIKLSGTQVNSDNFNPGTWVQYLNQNGGFSGSLFAWNESSWNGLVPNWHLENNNIPLPSSKQEKIQIVRKYLESGYYPIMCVKKNCGHWVAVTGVTDDNIQIADPGSGATTVWPTYSEVGTTRISIFRKTD